jgi:3-hydroxyisobutyrate dehydrogenase-like beta-hydroxyacid dehydrogenase
MRLGFIGAGRMGRPMVDRLVAAGHDVSVLGRTKEARDDLETAGAHAVADAKDAARGAAVVCVCVFSDEQVRQVCLDDGLLEWMPEQSALSAAARRGSAAGFAEAVREFLGKDVAVVRGVAADLGASLGVLDAAIGELSI